MYRAPKTADLFHAPPEFLRTLRDLTHENDALLVFDEVQTGMGITGRMWAHQHDDIRPDLLAFGKWPDKPDSRGLTALMLAAQLGDIASAEALLKAGANPNRSGPGGDRTPRG